MSGSVWRGTRTTCGATYSGSRGDGSRRRRPSSVGRPRSATSSDPRIVAARLARDLMRLCFLLERRYAPYSKWLGSSFARLDAAREVRPALERALTAEGAEEREAGLVAAYEGVARRFNALNVAAADEPTARTYYSRPFLVLMADRFAEACFAALEDPWLRSLPPLGSVDQYLDSTDALYPERARNTKGVLTPRPRPTSRTPLEPASTDPT